MSSKSTISVTVGVSGSGKTYYRCAVFLAEEWLPNHSGVLITNYPILMENLVKDFPNAEKRVELIPKEVLQAWRDGRSGPWDYLDGREISGCHIAIDEIHNYCGKNTDNKIRKKWLSWIGELRHQGATCEFLTQSEAKCAKEILSEAEIRYEIINGENRIFPILGYRMGDLYEFRAKILGRYLCPSFCREYIQAGSKWVLQKEHIFYRLPKYFQYYDSYSAPEHGKAEGHKAEKRPWEKYSWPMLFVWFYLQYPFRIMFQTAVLVTFIYIFFGGGLGKVMDSYFSALEGVGKTAIKEKEIKQDNKSIYDYYYKDETKKDDKNKESNNNNEGVSKFNIVVKLKPYEVLTHYKLKLRNGIEYKRGDVFYNSVILGFDKDFCYLQDGFYFPVKWLYED